MDDIAVFNMEDLLGNVKLLMDCDPADLEAAGMLEERDSMHDTNKYAPQRPKPPPSGQQRTVLDQVCYQLYDAYVRTTWCAQSVPCKDPMPTEMLIPLLRALLAAWEDPHDSFATRLWLTEEMGKICGVESEVLQQAILTCMHMNQFLFQQLQLQHLALLTDLYHIRPEHFKQPATYKFWRRRSLEDVVDLLLEQLKLPETNGILKLVVREGSDIVYQSRVWRKPRTNMPLFTKLWLEVPKQQGGGKQTRTFLDPSEVVTGRDPEWQHETESSEVNDDTDLHIEVRTTRKESGSRDMKGRMREKLIGKTGVRLASLTPGLPMTLELQLYGRKRLFSCGCASKQPEEAEGAVVFDAATGETLGTEDRPPIGTLTLDVTYSVERRFNQSMTLEVDLGNHAGEPSLAFVTAPKGLPAMPISDSATMIIDAVLGHISDTLGTYRARQGEDFVHGVKAAISAEPILPDDSLDPLWDAHQYYIRLAAAMYRIHQKGRLAEIVDYVPIIMNEPWMGEYGALLEQEEERLSKYLPLGVGLYCLTLVAKLFRIRRETQQLVLLQYVLAGWKAELEYFTLLRALMHDTIMWPGTGMLTRLEEEGFKCMLSTFMCRAVPTLQTHHSVFPREESADCFKMLWEMMGWVLTMSPNMVPPIDMVAPDLQRAATHRMLTRLVVVHETLPSAIQEVLEEITNIEEDLERDLEIEDMMPGLKKLAMKNCRARYTILRKHLTALFMANPGESSVTMVPFFALEEVILNLHETMLGLDYAIEADDEPVVNPKTGRAEWDSPAKTTGKIVLYNFEGALTEQLRIWVMVTANEQRPLMERLVQHENWQPASSTQKVASSILEMLRIVQAQVELSMEHALGGSDRRRVEVGKEMVTNLMGLLVDYVKLYKSFWDDELRYRLLMGSDIDLNMLASQTQGTAAKVAGSGPSSLTLANGSTGGARPASNTVRLMPVSIGQGIASGNSFLSKTAPGPLQPRAKSSLAPPAPLSSAASDAGSGTTSRAQYAITTVAVDPNVGITVPRYRCSEGGTPQPTDEPGAIMSQVMCIMRNSMHLLVEEVFELEEALIVLVTGGEYEGYDPGMERNSRVTPPERRSHRHSQGGHNAGQMTMMRSQRRAGLENLRNNFVSKGCNDLLAEVREMVNHMKATYAMHYRAAIMRGVALAFSATNEDECTETLQWLLGTMDEELGVLQEGISNEHVLAEMVLLSWRSVVDAMQHVALNQAGFRPLTEKEADISCDFVISMHEMYADLEKKLPQTGYGLTKSLLDEGQSYCSSLLRCCTESTEMLKDRYNKLLDPSKASGGAAIIGGNRTSVQISLLDLLRLLRQRRKTDAAAQSFLSEQLKYAQTHMLQVVFGLGAERMAASARCGKLDAMGREGGRGMMFLTQRWLCFTTLLDTDIKGTTDTTFKVPLAKVDSIEKDAKLETRLFITTVDAEVHTFCGFRKSDRDYIVDLLARSKETAVADGQDGFGYFMSHRCQLYQAWASNKSGVLNIFQDRVEFQRKNTAYLTIPLTDITTITQKAGWMGATWLSISVVDVKEPYLFGGLAETVMNEIIQSVTELITEEGGDLNGHFVTPPEVLAAKQGGASHMPSGANGMMAVHNPTMMRLVTGSAPSVTGSSTELVSRLYSFVSEDNTASVCSTPRPTDSPRGSRAGTGSCYSPSPRK